MVQRGSSGQSGSTGLLLESHATPLQTAISGNDGFVQELPVPCDGMPIASVTVTCLLQYCGGRSEGGGAAGGAGAPVEVGSKHFDQIDLMPAGSACCSTLVLGPSAISAAASTALHQTEAMLMALCRIGLLKPSGDTLRLGLERTTAGQQSRCWATTWPGSIRCEFGGGGGAPSCSDAAGREPDRASCLASGFSVQCCDDFDCWYRLCAEPHNGYRGSFDQMRALPR